MGSLPEDESTSKRIRTPATHINVGTLGDVSHLVFMKLHNEEYILNMQELKLNRLPEEQRHNLLNLDACTPEEQAKWLAADVRDKISHPTDGSNRW